MNMPIFKPDIVDKTSETCILLYKSAIEDVKNNKLVSKFKNCYNHLETLINCQKKYCMVERPILIKRKEKLDTLLLKVREAVKIDLLESKCGNGYGLSALNSIQKYDEILRVSKNNMITEDNAYNSVFGSFLRSDPVTRSMPNLAMALFVLNELYDSNSSHFDYIDSLPTKVDTYLYLTPEDIALLQPSQYLNEIVQQFCNICSHYCYFSRVLFELKQMENCHFKDRFCFEDFRWAVSIIMSRNNAIPREDGKSRMLALVPIWDMMNHQFGEVTTDFDDETQSLVFYAMQDYSPGDEICMDYGKRSSLQYFMYSGFVPDQNPHDIYSMKIGFNAQDTLYEKKSRVLSRIGIDCKTVTFNVNYLSSPMIDQSMVAYLSIMLVKSDEVLMKFLESEDIAGDIGEYSGLVRPEVESFLSTRVRMNLGCIESTIGKMGLATTPITSIDSLELLKHERFILQQIAAKL